MDFLNAILNRSCPADRDELNNVHTFILDLHCQEATITAKMVEPTKKVNGEWVDAKYEVISITFRHI